MGTHAIIAGGDTLRYVHYDGDLVGHHLLQLHQAGHGITDLLHGAMATHWVSLFHEPSDDADSHGTAYGYPTSLADAATRWHIPYAWRLTPTSIQRGVLAGGRYVWDQPVPWDPAEPTPTRTHV